MFISFGMFISLNLAANVNNNLCKLYYCYFEIKGYGWQICTCRVCRHHIGWKYTASESTLKPEKFYGITRKSISYSYAKAANDSDTRLESSEDVNN